MEKTIPSRDAYHVLAVTTASLVVLAISAVAVAADWAVRFGTVNTWGLIILLVAFNALGNQMVKTLHVSVRGFGFLAKHIVLFGLLYSSGVRGLALWAAVLYYLLFHYRRLYVRSIMN